MQIGINDIPRRGLILREQIAAEQALLTDEDRATGEVSLDVRLDRSGQQVRILGSVRAQFVSECHRCADPAHLDVAAEIDSVFQPRPHGEPAAYVELDEEALGLSYYDGLTLDLAPLLRDALLLAMPMVHLCREDCPGLCARCGKNGDVCACPPAEIVAPGNPFAEFLRRQRESG